MRATPWRSYLRLLRKGLAKPSCCHDDGGLLHHRFSFSLTRRGGQRESSFLRRFPSGYPAWPLASILPGAGITWENAEDIAQAVGVPEVHGTRIVRLSR